MGRHRAYIAYDYENDDTVMEGAEFGCFPERQSPYFNNSSEVWYQFFCYNHPEEDGYEAKCLFYNTYGAKMNKQQLKMFMDSFDSNNEETDIREYIEELNDDTTYILVACDYYDEDWFVDGEEEDGMVGLSMIIMNGMAVGKLKNGKEKIRSLKNAA